MSALLLDSLELAAASNPQAHQLLAALYRCAKPNPYLHEESLKGRILTAVERAWVDEYLRLTPKYQKYETHLKAAALGGVRAAALEYGTVFDSPQFLALAERLGGDVDAIQMARVASTPEARSRWLRTAAEAGSRSALRELAEQGDTCAEELVAPRAGAHWLRSAAERALADGDAVRAWTWQYLALAQGIDLTRSTMSTRHASGPEDGEFHDSDEGAWLSVEGDEGLEMPELSPVGHQEARKKAQDICDVAPKRPPPA